MADCFAITTTQGKVKTQPARLNSFAKTGLKVTVSSDILFILEV
jgi:histidinol phosphatase-like PHP family hydrolase